MGALLCPPPRQQQKLPHPLKCRSHLTDLNSHYFNGLTQSEGIENSSLATAPALETSSQLREVTTATLSTENTSLMDLQQQHQHHHHHQQQQQPDQQHLHTPTLDQSHNQSQASLADAAASIMMMIDTELLITGFIYGITFLVGMIGNSLIVYSVLQYRHMKSLSNIFLASLATADLILVIFCVPVKFAQLFSYTWTFGRFLCKFVHYIQNLSAICSVYTLTAISIERYYAIIYPVECRYIRTISQTKRIIVLTWLGSIILAMPVLWTQILMEVGDNEHRGYWCIKDWSNELGWQIYELYMLIIILVIPLTIMTYSYAHICRQLWFVMSERNSQFQLTTAQPTIYVDASANKMSQVIQMLIVVVVIFVICWTPILFINVLTAFKIVPLLNYGNLKAIKTTFHLLSYANSCVNPIVYGFMSSNFRASFKAAFMKCFGKIKC